ncbi:Ribonuclease H2 subunit A [Armadillidium vulgare]|nr:Ribonuclease H2 subunit A [Armadillidium vulgare]
MVNSTIPKKEDLIEPIVAIILQRVRDCMLVGSVWSYYEDLIADSVTKNFLNSSLDRIFGFPALVRFSWSTAEKILEEKGVSVKWLHEVAEEEDENTPSVLQYFAKKRKLSSGTEEPTPVCKNNSKRHFYYIDRSLSRVSEL